MMITTQKAKEEILSMLSSYPKVVIIGCGGCAATCQTGGSEQVKEWEEKSLGGRVLASIMCEEPCDERLLRRDLRRIKKELEEADAVLVLACGLGVQNAVEVTGKVCLPGLDSHFYGKAERLGRFFERCRACGDCLLGETGGICFLTRCPKGLANGPCEGMADGKCEVREGLDCVWKMIYDRLDALGQLEKLSQVRDPEDWSKRTRPQEVIWQRGATEARGAERKG
ncbi:MAG: methylenetetrahydrofolate reductase C-terminal domain-containing protein [bacterium]|jgi:ferredoxin